ASIVNCVFAGNSAGKDGGAVYLFDTASPSLVNCLFTGNRTRNNTTGTGAALSMNTSSGGPTLSNCTLADNPSAFQGGGVYDGSLNGIPTIRNSILWNNSDNGLINQASQIRSAGGPAPAVTYCDVYGSYTGTGNLGNNPVFLPPASSSTWTAA